MVNKNKQHTSLTVQLVLLAIGLGVIYWLLESVMDALIFRENNLMEMMLLPNAYHIWHRSLVICILVLSAGIIQFIIKARKRTEDELRESEKRFRTIFENAPIGIDIVDKEGRPLYVNSALQEMLGFRNRFLF